MIIRQECASVNLWKTCYLRFCLVLYFTASCDPLRCYRTGCGTEDVLDGILSCDRAEEVFITANTSVGSDTVLYTELCGKTAADMIYLENMKKSYENMLILSCSGMHTGRCAQTHKHTQTRTNTHTYCISRLVPNTDVPLQQVVKNIAVDLICQTELVFLPWVLCVFSPLSCGQPSLMTNNSHKHTLSLFVSRSPSLHPSVRSSVCLCVCVCVLNAVSYKRWWR